MNIFISLPWYFIFVHFTIYVTFLTIRINRTCVEGSYLMYLLKVVLTLEGNIFELMYHSSCTFQVTHVTHYVVRPDIETDYVSTNQGWIQDDWLLIDRKANDSLLNFAAACSVSYARLKSCAICRMSGRNDGCDAHPAQIAQDLSRA